MQSPCRADYLVRFPHVVFRHALAGGLFVAGATLHARFDFGRGENVAQRKKRSAAFNPAGGRVIRLPREAVPDIASADAGFVHRRRFRPRIRAHGEPFGGNAVAGLFGIAAFAVEVAAR